MTKMIYSKHSENCPYTNSLHTIDVKYAEIPNQLHPGYKLMSYSCCFSEECPYPKKDPFGRCPVFMTAPQQPN